MCFLETFIVTNALVIPTIMANYENQKFKNVPMLFPIVKKHDKSNFFFY